MRRLVLAFLLAAIPTAVPAQRQPEWRQAREERINIALGEFAPEIIRLRAGEPTRLIFYNSGQAPLGVAAERFFEAARIRSGDESVRDGFSVRPGELREVLLVPAPGRYRLRSASLYRRLLGMSAEIVVE